MNINKNSGNINSNENTTTEDPKKLLDYYPEFHSDGSHKYRLETLEGRPGQNDVPSESLIQTLEYYPDKDGTGFEKLGIGEQNFIEIDSPDFSKIDASKLPDGLIDEEERPSGNKTHASAPSRGSKVGSTNSSSSEDVSESSDGIGDAPKNTQQARTAVSESAGPPPVSAEKSMETESKDISQTAQKEMVERQKRVADTDQKVLEKRKVEQLIAKKDQILERARMEGKTAGNSITLVIKGLSEAAEKGWIDKNAVKDFKTDLKVKGILYEVKMAKKNIPFGKHSEVTEKATDAVLNKMNVSEEEKKEIKAKVSVKEYQDSWRDKALFENDPKAWCWPKINENERDLINEGVLNLTDKAQRAQNAIEVGLRFQREMMPGKKPRYLSNVEREKMGKEYEILQINGKPDWNARFELVKKWKKKYGEYYENVLSELELEPKNEFLLRFGINAEKSNLNSMIRIVENNTNKELSNPGDYAKPTDTDSNWNKPGIGKTLKFEFEKIDIGKKIGEMVVSNGNNALPAWLQEGLKMMYQQAEYLHKGGMPVETAAKVVARDFTNILDKNMKVVSDPKAGSVIVPKHYDEFFVNTGLVWIRNNVISSTKNLDPNDRIIWKNDGDRLSLVKIDGQGNEELLKDEVGELYDFSPMEVHRIVENSVFGYRVDPDLIDLNQSMKPLIDTEKIGKTMDYLRGIDTKHTGRNKLWDQKQWDWEEVVQAVMNDNIGSRLMWILMENNIKIDMKEAYTGDEDDSPAFYEPFWNKIKISPNFSTDDVVSILIHESKHALVDLIDEGWKGIKQKYDTSNTDQNKLDGETAAFLSQIFTLEALRSKCSLINGKTVDQYQPGDFLGTSVRIDHLKKGKMVDEIFDKYKDDDDYKLDRNKVMLNDPLTGI